MLIPKNLKMSHILPLLILFK